MMGNLPITVREIGKDKFEVESFTTTGTFYVVDVEAGTCSCPDFRKRKMECKHLDLMRGNSKYDKAEEFTLSTSLLMSALQKNVRRNRAEEAGRVGAHLLKKDPVKAARRLPIIVLEDALLHPSFADLVNLTSRASKKGYEVTGDDLELYATVCRDIGRVEWRDLARYPIQAEGRKIFDEFVEKFKNTEHLRLVRAIEGRLRLGGMKDDLVMMSMFRYQWAKRFWDDEDWLQKIQTYYPDRPVKDVLAEKVYLEPMEPADIPIEAVDQHCSSLERILARKAEIIDWLKREFGRDVNVYQQIKEAVWNCRSSVNFKKCIDTGEVVSGWTKDSKALQKYQKFVDIFGEEIDNVSAWFLKRNARG